MSNENETQTSAEVACRSTMYGLGCFHPIDAHTGHGSCCCCSGRHNDPQHIAVCLDCAVKHAKSRVRREQGKSVPLVHDVEPFIPEPLKAAFWERYLGKYFDSTTEPNEETPA